MKKKTIAEIGGTSTVVGGVGVILASMGLCACFWGPALSLAGFGSIVVGFLTNFALFSNRVCTAGNQYFLLSKGV